jgi:hypothetical protein
VVTQLEDKEKQSMRKFVIAAGAALALSGATAAGAGAASNPAGTGQPGAGGTNQTACGSGTASSEPPGFLTAGFAHAGTVYANPGTTPSQSGRAVAEYDIACYQQTQNH